MFWLLKQCDLLLDRWPPTSQPQDLSISNLAPVVIPNISCWSVFNLKQIIITLSTSYSIIIMLVKDFHPAPGVSRSHEKSLQANNLSPTWWSAPLQKLIPKVSNAMISWRDTQSTEWLQSSLWRGGRRQAVWPSEGDHTCNISKSLLHVMTASKVSYFQVFSLQQSPPLRSERRCRPKQAELKKQGESKRA